MKTAIKRYAGLTSALALAVLTVVAPSGTAFAQIKGGIDDAKGDGVPDELFGGEGSIFTTVVNVLLFIIGALSVVMLIWGGIRYTTSGGSSSAVTSAKNTIMYAIIGLVVAFLAFAIVNWVLGAVDPSAS